MKFKLSKVLRLKIPQMALTPDPGSRITGDTQRMSVCLVKKHLY